MSFIPPRARLLHFVLLRPFESAWSRLGLTDDALRELEVAIMVDPLAPPVVRGTGGLRKIRFSPHDWKLGKRGALRVCYVFFSEQSLVCLVTVYGKGRKEDLSDRERGIVKKLIDEIREELKRGDI